MQFTDEVSYNIQQDNSLSKIHFYC